MHDMEDTGDISLNMSSPSQYFCQCRYCFENLGSPCPSIYGKSIHQIQFPTYKKKVWRTMWLWSMMNSHILMRKTWKSKALGIIKQMLHKFPWRNWKTYCSFFLSCFPKPPISRKTTVQETQETIVWGSCIVWKTFTSTISTLSTNDFQLKHSLSRNILSGQTQPCNMADNDWELEIF